MDKCYSFNFENVSQNGIIIHSNANILSHEGELHVFDHVSQDCKEIEVVSTDHASIENTTSINPLENQSTDEITIEQWEDSCAEVVVGNEQEQLQDEEIPLPMDQNEYMLSMPYPCDFCEKRFKKKLKYLKHMAAHQRLDRNYECTACGIRFMKLNDLINHQKIHESPSDSDVETKTLVADDKKFLVCHLCGVGFTMQKAYISHMSIHEGDSPLACKQCNQTFWDMHSLENHWKTIHAILENQKSVSKKRKKDGSYCCTTCGLSFCSQNDLKRHQQNHDNEEIENSELGYICNICGESYSSTYEFVSHAKEMHSDGFEYQCMKCGENFIDEDAWLEHSQEQHLESEILHCKTTDQMKQIRKPRKMREPFDNEQLFSESSLRKSSDQPFSCTMCGKNFTTRSSQQIHMRIHTGERPYGCRFCHKAFTDGGTLRKHERIHTGEKPYACVICSKAFNQRVVLREHIRSHHSSPDPLYAHSMTPFSCGVCSDMFAASQDLIIHLIQHCDTNTAMKRPPRTGPRKYVRRNKLKHNEYDVQDEQSEEESYPVQQMETPKYEIDMEVRWTDSKYASSKRETTHFEQSFAEEKSPEKEYIFNYSEQENGMNTGRNVSKAKMIHTEKRRKYNLNHKQGQFSVGSSINNQPPEFFSENVSAVDNLLRLGESIREENCEQSTSFKTETLETEIDETVVYSDEIHQNSDESFVAERSLVETQESYSCSTNEEQYDLIGNSERDEDTKTECEEQVVYETPEEYAVYENEKVNAETISRYLEPVPQDSIVDQYLNVKQEMMDPLLEFAEISMQHAKSLFKCEMCSSVFLERGQLMAHVRIHI